MSVDGITCLERIHCGAKALLISFKLFVLINAVVGFALYGLTTSSAAASLLKIAAASSSKLTAILLFGEIRSGDMNELLSIQAANKTEATVLFLESPGGDASEGLLIAKFVRNLGWSTATVSGAKCFSACATIWIAGKARFLSSDAIVGFHDVYDNSGSPSAPGNALVGAFYGQLGLSDRVIQYLTVAPPNSFNRVDLGVASSIGLDVIDYDKLAQPSTATEGSQSNASQSTALTPNRSNDEIIQTPLASSGTSTAIPQSPVVQTAKFTHFASVDIIGHDIPNAAVSALSAEYCEQVCEARSECRAFTFDTKHQICFPKDGGKLKLFDQRAVSGAKSELLQGMRLSSISLHGKSKFLASEFKKIAPSLIGECIEQCDLDGQCKQLSYSSATNTCLLFDTNSSTSPAVGWLTGTKH